MQSETVNVDVLPTIDHTDFRITDDTTIDDLIPQELKQAEEKVSSPAKEDTKVRHQAPQPKTKTQAPSIQTPQEPQIQTQPQAPATEDDDNISLDDIDKLLDGDFDSLHKKDTQTQDQDEPQALWSDIEGYKTLKTRLKQLGVPQKELDSTLQELVDKQSLSSNVYLKGLEDKTISLEKELEYLRKDHERLKQIEKSAYFDSLPEVKSTYIEPMTEHITAIKSMLDYTGEDIPLTDVLNANNRKELTDIVGKVNWDSEDLSKLTNHWKSYKDVMFKYHNAKKEAQTNINKYISTEISAKDGDTILRNALVDFSQSSDKYKYIVDAINEKKVGEDEDVSYILANARANFQAMLKALADPTKVVRDPNWLETLAKRELEREHNYIIQKKYYDLLEEVKTKDEKTLKLAKAYKKLHDSARGLNGKSKRAYYDNGFSGTGKLKNNVLEDDVKAFSAFIDGKLDIDDLI